MYLRAISIYDRIQAADERCKEIVEELRSLPSIEYCPQQTRGLNNEYIWTVNVVIRLCDDILGSEPDDGYGEEVDFRIKLTHFQERYENIRDKIST